MESSLPQVQIYLTGALTALLVAGVIVTSARSSFLGELPRRELVLLVVCVALGLALRLAARTFVATTTVTSEHLGIESAHRWAAGLSAILKFLALFGQVSVASLAKLNVILSVATIVALFVLVDTYFEDRLAAFAAAAVFALQPISARYANSDGSGVMLTLCLVVGAAFLARWNRRGGYALLLQGVGWLVLAANIRYEGVVYVAAGACIIFGGRGWPRRGRTLQLVPAGLLAVLFLAFPVWRALRDAPSLGVIEVSPLEYLGAFPMSPHSPAAVVVIAFVGLITAVLDRYRAGTFFLFALVVAALPGMYIPLECSEFPHRFALPALALWAAFAGYGCSAARRLLPRALARLRGAGGAPPVAPAGGISTVTAAVILALTAATVIPHRTYLRQMWTHALEYDFVVEHLRTIPDECLIVGPDNDREPRGLRFSPFLSIEVGRRHRWARIDDPAVLAGRLAPCTVYYRATTCFAYEAPMQPQNPDWTGAERPVCRRIAELFDLEPIATTAIPVRSYMCEAHTVNPAPAGFYWLRPRAAAGGRR